MITETLTSKVSHLPGEENFLELFRLVAEVADRLRRGDLTIEEVEKHLKG